MEGKRITFSTNTPNDQGGIIPNETIDFSRFTGNPVILKQHRWEEPPLGLMTDIKLENGKWTGIPVFHKITDDSKEYAELYEKGFLRACSIGGLSEWKTNTSGQTYYNKDNLRVCEKFDLYEISMVSLPSNRDAITEDPIQLAAKIYNDAEKDQVVTGITNLSSKFKPNMEPTKTSETATTTGGPEKTNTAAPAATEEKTTLATDNPEVNELPKVVKDVLGFFGLKNVFAGSDFKPVTVPAVEKAPGTEKPATEAPAKVANPPQPTPIGLSAKEKAKSKAEKDKEAAEMAIEKCKTLKEAAEKEGATDDDKKKYESAHSDMEAAMKKAEASAKAAEEAEDDDDAEEDEEGAKKGKSKNSAAPAEKTGLAAKPILKTMEELKAEATTLAPKPTHTAKVTNLGAGVTFSQLQADKEGSRILDRVLAKDAGGKEIADYAIVLNSILQDGRFSKLAKKIRLFPNVTESHLKAYQQNPDAPRAGIGLMQLASKLNGGHVDMLGRNNTMSEVTTLNATDDFLASPDLYAVEFLSLAIFALFPSTDWKKDIPIFGAQETGKNTGIIWANVNADPGVTKGDKPANPATYEYDDIAVSLALVPYWLQPMLWTPLTMHQLRYDKMSTGWAQAFAKWAAVMDDQLIYTVASTVPAGSIINSTGGPNPNTNSFTLTGANDPNSFFYNPGLLATLLKPAYNDIMSLEQIYSKQNFDLSISKPTLVIDPTMDKFISQDPDTKSLLTRWVEANPGQLLRIKNTNLTDRSRVAIYDPATGQVKSPDGVIPPTAVSAALSFIPSQVGIGMGMLDVFMIQDPSAYGYKMSADTRTGIAPLRKNYNGTALYTYGTPNV